MAKIVQESMNVNTQEENYLGIASNEEFKKKNQYTLQNNFIRALKNPDFVSVANTLDVPDEVKYRYTSTIEEIANNVSTCRNCKGLSFCPFSLKGVRKDVYVEDGLIKFIYRNCPYKEKNDQENAYLKNVYLYKIPKEISEASFKKIYKDDAKRLETIKYLKEFYDNYKKGKFDKGLYLYGNFGCGKTYLVAALFNELAKIGVKSTIVYFPEFLRSLKASFGNIDDNYDEKFERVSNSPLLLLDDIGAEKLTDWARDEVLGVILQHRMEENLPTFLTSNLSLKELEEHLEIISNGPNKVKARRIIERIKYLTNEIKMVSVNRRN